MLRRLPKLSLTNYMLLKSIEYILLIFVHSNMLLILLMILKFKFTSIMKNILS